MSVSTTVKKYGIEQAIKFMYKDPEKNLPKLMDWRTRSARDASRASAPRSAAPSRIRRIRTMTSSAT